jgi:hypothetical protein
MKKPTNNGQQFITPVEASLELNAGRPKGMPPLEVITSEVLRIGFTRGDAESVYDFWLSNGFKVGARMVRDWKAAIRNMVRYNRLPSQQAKPPGLVEHQKTKPAQLMEAERDRLKTAKERPASETELRRVGHALRQWRKDNR